MHSRGTPQPRASRTTRWTLTLLAVAALVGGTAAPANAAGVAWMSTPTDSASATDAPDSQSPTDAETPSDTETPGDSQTPGDAEIPGDTQTPGDAENDADGETAGDVDADDTTQTPTDDETAVNGDAETEPQVEAPDADDVIEVESAEISMPTLAGFNAANLISDAVFTDESTMTEAQIQAFFDSKVKTCRGGSDKYGPIVCLKDFRTDSVTMPADKYCTGYTGAKGESAARIIYRAAQACNINPQVLIVMLQKEQSLVTHTWPSAWRYDKALGQGCPDTAPCNPKYVGFFHQIYGAAKQMQTYLEGRYFTWYSPGKTWNVLYHPNRSCGTSPLKIANAATSAMYYYTPYQPNAAALRAGYGTGDSCSSYGNRNFYNYFTDWFGSTQTV